MATSPLLSISPPSSDSSSNVIAPSIQPNTETSGTPPTSSPSTPATSPPPPSQSPPSPPSVPPPSSPAPPPVEASPSTQPSPATSSPPPPVDVPPPTVVFPPPSVFSPPPPVDFPPPPVENPPFPVDSPPPPVVFSPPPPKNESPTTPTTTPPPPMEKSPATPTVTSPPPHEKTPNTPPSPPVPESSTISPSPPGATLSPPPPSIPSSSTSPPVSTLAPPSNHSASGLFSPPVTIPTEKPIAKPTRPGVSDSVSSGVSQKGGGSGMKPGTAAALGLVVGFLALSLLVMAVWFTKWRKRRNGSGYADGYVMPSPFVASPDSDSSNLKPQNSPYLAESGSGSSFMYSSDPNSKSWFTYEELSNATQSFSAQKLLGEGGFGCVYKGLLVDGREVAVKQLKIGGGQGEREFRAEVEIISRVHHRHLVSLVGYCISDQQRLLVYEYVPNNTLHYHLHGEGRPVMEWSTRVKVAVGAARGIAYLHEDCHPRIIHRDIKSSNMLLDNNFDARVADFGLAKLAADANTHVSTRVMGTFGYLAPEYASSGKLTEKSDVFSYGVVLLELITGRKSVDGSQPLGDESLVEWARPLINEALENESFEDLIDPRLERNFVEIEMFRLIEAAAACIRHLAPKRPRMSQVVRAFETMDERSDLTNGMKLGHSKIHDSREQSAQIRMFQRLAFGSQEDYSSEYFERSHSSWKS